MTSARDFIRDALAYVPAHDRDIWVRMGMAVKSELGEDGYEVWAEWSQRDESFNEADAMAVWRSIKPGGKVTVATLFHEAQRHGYRATGRARSTEPTQAECEQRERQTQMAVAREAAAKLAGDVVKAALPARADHPYLARKHVPPVVTLRELPAPELARLVGYVVRHKADPLVGRVLVAAIWNGDAISSLEFIDESGRKSALADGAKSGGYWSAQRMPEGDGEGLTLYVCEGVATTLTVHIAADAPAFAALSCHNLSKAARALRARYPRASIIVCGELGRSARHAHSAAIAVGGRVAFPTFADAESHDGADFNDLCDAEGLDAVNRALANAGAPEASEPQPDAGKAPDGDSVRAVVHLVRGDEVRMRAVDWLWLNWLAGGKMHILAGAPGTGKTTLMLALAATITQGGRWPDGSRAAKGHVLIWSGEDSAGDTLAPRLLAMGADLSRVHFVGNVVVGGEPIPFDPAKHFAALAEAAASIRGLALMIVDPIVSAVAGDSHQNAEVRRGLAPLVTFAEQIGCALVGISHFTKGTQGREPLERITGSLGFGAVARIAFATAKLPQDEGGGRVFVRVKSNIGPEGDGFRYVVAAVDLAGTQAGITATRIEWGDPIEGSAREILANAELADDEAGGNPKDYLRALLADGPMDASEIFKDARANGFSKDQMHRAKKALAVQAQKGGFAAGWRWFLPGIPEGGGDCPVSPEGSEGSEDCAPEDSPSSALPSAASHEDGGEAGEGSGNKLPPSSPPSAAKVAGETF